MGLPDADCPGGDGRHEPAIRGDVVRSSNVWGSSGKWTRQCDRVPEGEGRLRRDADGLELAGSRDCRRVALCPPTTPDASGWPPLGGSWWLTPATAGKGCTEIVVVDPSVVAYATHRPSGENTAPVRVDEWTSPKGVDFLSVSDSIHSDTSEPFVTLNSSVSPSATISGSWASPASGVVSRVRLASVDRLPEEAAVAVAIGLEHHAFTVRRPRRKPVVASAREGFHRRRA